MKHIGKTALFISGLIILLFAVIFFWDSNSQKDIDQKKTNSSGNVQIVKVDTFEDDVPLATAEKLEFAPKEGETIGMDFNLNADIAVDYNFIQSNLNKSVNKKPASGSTVYSKLNAKSNKAKLASSGTLALKFFSVDQKTYQVAGKLVNITYDVNGTEPSFVPALQAPFYCEMKRNGLFKNFRFSKGVKNESAEFIRQLFSYMQTGLSSKIKNQWKMRENDSSGLFKASYRLVESNDDSVIIEKKKTKYVSGTQKTNEMNNILGPAKIEITYSKATIKMQNKAAWIDSIDLSESLSMISKQVNWGTSETEFSANSSKKNMSNLFPDSLADFLALLQSERELISKGNDIDPTYAAIWGNLSANGAIDAFLRMLSSDQTLAQKLMTNYLRLHPEKVYEIIDLLDQCSVSGDCENMNNDNWLTLWRMLAESNNPEVMSAMLDAATDNNRTKNTRLAAMSHLHLIEDPSSEMLDKLWNIYNDDNYVDGEIKNMSLLVYGHMADPEKAGGSLQDDIVNNLSQHLANANDLQDIAMTIAAIGNSGNDRLLPDLRKVILEGETETRKEAFDAMRRMNTPDARNALTEEYENEGNFAVKAAAIDALSNMEPTSDNMKWARLQLSKAEDVFTQRSIAKMLGENLKQYPENEIVLRQLLVRNPPLEVRREIYKYIAPEINQ